MLFIQVLSVEKTVCVREEEVLLVNGTPITLEGEEGRAIKDCLLRGAIPNQVIITLSLLSAASKFCISGPDKPPADQGRPAVETNEGEHRVERQELDNSE